MTQQRERHASDALGNRRSAERDSDTVSPHNTCSLAPPQGGGSYQKQHSILLATHHHDHAMPDLPSDYSVSDMESGNVTDDEMDYWTGSVRCNDSYIAYTHHRRHRHRQRRRGRRCHTWSDGDTSPSLNAVAAAAAAAPLDVNRVATPPPRPVPPGASSEADSSSRTPRSHPRKGFVAASAPSSLPSSTSSLPASVAVPFCQPVPRSVEHNDQSAGSVIEERYDPKTLLTRHAGSQMSCTSFLPVTSNHHRRRPESTNKSNQGHFVDYGRDHGRCRYLYSVTDRQGQSRSRSDGRSHRHHGGSLSACHGDDRFELSPDQFDQQHSRMSHVAPRDRSRSSTDVDMYLLTRSSHEFSGSRPSRNEQQQVRQEETHTNVTSAHHAPPRTEAVNHQRSHTLILPTDRSVTGITDIASSNYTSRFVRRTSKVMRYFRLLCSIFVVGMIALSHADLVIRRNITVADQQLLLTDPYDHAEIEEFFLKQPTEHNGPIAELNPSVNEGSKPVQPLPKYELPKLSVPKEARAKQNAVPSQKTTVSDGSPLRRNMAMARATQHELPVFGGPKLSEDLHAKSKPAYVYNGGGPHRVTEQMDQDSNAGPTWKQRRFMLQDDDAASMYHRHRSPDQEEGSWFTSRLLIVMLFALLFVDGVCQEFRSHRRQQQQQQQQQQFPQQRLRMPLESANRASSASALAGSAIISERSDRPLGHTRRQVRSHRL